MLARKPKLGMIAGVLAVSFGAAPASMLWASPARLDFPETVDVAPRVVAYRLVGDFRQTGHSVDAPLVAVAHFKVEGQWNDDLMKQMSPAQPIVAVEVPQKKSN